MNHQKLDKVEETDDSPLAQISKFNASFQVSDGARAVHVGTEAGLTPTLRHHSHPASDVDADPEQRQWKCLLVEPEEEKVLRVRTSRRCYTRSQMDDAYRLITFPRPPLSRTLRDLCRCSRRCMQSGLLRFVPVLSLWKSYGWPNAIDDMTSGLSAGFLHLPQGLGFGLLASLSPIHGLYSSFFPVLVYMVFGTSPHVSMGTNAVVALLTAAIVDREAESYLFSKADNQTVTEAELLQYKVGVATTSCFAGGLILIAMGLMRMGFLTNFMSKSFIQGFSFAAAVHITVSQVVKLLHLQLPSRSGMGKLVYTTINIFTNITDTHLGDVVVGIVCGSILLGVNIGVNKRYKHKLKVPIPIELIVVVLSTLVSHFADFNGRFNIDVVGDIPQGMPTPSLPPLHIVPRVAKDSFVTAILIFALTISMGKLTAKLHDIQIDDNQELVAYGLCQLVGSVFQNFFSSISPPRTMLLSSMGAKSTLNGLPSAAFILLVLLVLGQLFVSLPIAMLAAMIIVAMKDLLMQLSLLKVMWHVNKADFFIWLLTAVVSVFGDLDIGLLVGVVFSMVTVLVVSQLAKGRVLGKADREDIIMDLNRKGINAIPGVRIIRFESELHFASAERFKSEMYSKIFDPTSYKHKDHYEIEVEVSTSQAATLSLDPIPVAPAEEPQPKNLTVAFETKSTSLMMPESRDHLTIPDITVEGPEPSDISTGKSRGAVGPVPTRENPAPLKATDSAAPHPRTLTNYEDDLRHVIVDCSMMTYIDMSGIAMLHLIIMQFSRAGLAILLTDIPPTTMGILTRAKFFEHADNQKVYYSVLDALAAIRAIQPIRGFRKSFA